MIITIHERAPFMLVQSAARTASAVRDRFVNLVWLSRGVNQPQRGVTGKETFSIKGLNQGNHNAASANTSSLVSLSRG